MSFNKVILIGNLTRDTELRQTQSGISVLQFSIAVNGSNKDDVSFIECKAFSKTAENINKYFTRGKPILIEGRLKQESWTDKETGKQRSKIAVIADRFEFVGGKVESDGKDDAADDLEDSDVPF